MKTISLKLSTLFLLFFFVSALKGAATLVLDLQGRTVIPGLIDNC